MRHPIDALTLLVLFALLAILMGAHAVGTAKTGPHEQVQRRAPIGDLDRLGTRFDLLFREPELLR